MEIYRCTKITKNVVHAFEKLVPQLDPGGSAPSASYLEELVSSSGNVLFLAKEKDEIIASLTLIIYQIPTARKAFVEDVVVDIKHRGKGIGKELLNSAIALAKDEGITKVDLTSRPERKAANELYKKLGFKLRDTNIYRLTL